MCTRKKKKNTKSASKGKKNRSPDLKRSKSKKSKKSKKEIEKISQKSSKKELETQQTEPVKVPEVKPAQVVPKVPKVAEERLDLFETQTELSTKLKKKALLKEEATVRTSDETQHSTVRTELFDNAQCNPFPIDLKKIFNKTQGNDKEWRDQEDTDEDNTLAGIDSGFENFDLPMLVRNTRLVEKKRTKRPRIKATKEDRSLVTQGSE